MNYGGGEEIRTLGGLSPSLVFKTSAFNRSATPPRQAENFTLFLLLLPMKWAYGVSLDLLFGHRKALILGAQRV